MVIKKRSDQFFATVWYKTCALKISVEKSAVDFIQKTVRSARFGHVGHCSRMFGVRLKTEFLLKVLL